MTENVLTSLLAQRVLGWTLAADRYLIGNRQWRAKWRFQPLTRVEDAFRLLERAAAEEYTFASQDGCFWASVRIAGVTGEAHESSEARAITLALARALGMVVAEEPESSRRQPEDPNRAPGSRRNA